MHREVDILLMDWSEWVFSHHAYPKKTLAMMPHDNPGPRIPDFAMPDRIAETDRAVQALKRWHPPEALAIRIRYIPMDSGRCRTQDEQYEAWSVVTTKSRRAFHDALRGAAMFLEGRLL